MPFERVLERHSEMRLLFLINEYNYIHIPGGLNGIVRDLSPDVLLLRVDDDTYK
jgi:hypothetical protein